MHRIYFVGDTLSIEARLNEENSTEKRCPWSARRHAAFERAEHS